MSLDITFLHLIIMLLTIAVVIFGGIYVARAVKSAEGYSLGGRSASFPLVAGSIAGTVIGGGATVGLSAWWFTLSSGITFIVMGFQQERSGPAPHLPDSLLVGEGRERPSSTAQP